VQRVLALAVSASLIGAAAASASDYDKLAHENVLSRAGYGQDSWSRARIAQLGAADYVEEQLHPDAIPDPELDALLAPLSTLGLSFRELREHYHGRDDAVGPIHRPLQELVEAKVLRAVVSRRQLEAVLTDFWFDYFNVNASDGLVRWAVVPYERDAIRPHVLGRFEDMLRAVASSTAMLFYLDNYLSTREGFRIGRRVLGLNENYGRELLELHSVGVEANFTQRDVIDVARCLTGWTIDVDGSQGSKSGFVYRDDAHDKGEKRVMGELVIPPGRGLEDGLELIAWLARHPLTAERVARKLLQRFVSDEPSESQVAVAKTIFLSSGGDLRELMRVILGPNLLFSAPDSFRAKVKRPLHFVASWIRATSADPALTLAQATRDLKTLGEPVYRAAPPTGFPDHSAHWAGAGTLVARLNIASRIARQASGLGAEWAADGGSAGHLVDRIGEQLVPGGISAETRAAIVAYLETLERRSDPVRVRAAAALLLSSKEFMLH